jgi:choice-of-anchor C domain-containing protein
MLNFSGIGLQQLDDESWGLDNVRVTVQERQNIVTNGDFEVPDAGSTFVTYRAGQSFGGWTVESGDIDHTGTLWQAASGRQSVDLNRCSTGLIHQDLSTIPGQTYLLRFALAGNPDGEPAIKQMEALWDPTSVGRLSFDTTGRSRSSMGWGHQQYTVVATASVTRLWFRSLTAGCYGPVLDDVSVMPIR